ncbi:MAG: PorT family protein [Candidatus Aminicenantes bacterium]|nr:PorT family protein [Candidatus Aminicenantes bacterium]
MIGKKGREIIVLIFLLIWSSINSNLWSSPIQISPGVKFGGGISNIFGQDTFEQQWQISAAAGIFLDIMMSKSIHLQPEIFWFRKGSKTTLSQDQLSYQEKLFLDYLQIPLYLKLFFLDSHRFRFYIYGGPAIAFNLKARLKVTFDGLNESVEVYNLKGNDFLLSSGIGTEFRLRPGSLLLEFRYEEGLKSVSTDIQSDIKNRNLSIIAGYKF